MITFKCNKCRSVVRTADENAGKKGKCPKCGQALVVPAVTEPINPSSELQFSSPPTTDKSQQNEYRLAFHGRTASDEKEPPPERKLPFFIDVFLYPLNKSGLVMLAIFIGVPFILKVLGQFMRVAMLSLPALLPFFLAFGIIDWLIDSVLLLYFFWYFAECVRSSAGGWVRAPDTAAITPGLAEIIWQILDMVLCVLLFFLPAALYYYNVRETDWKFIALLSSGTFLFPMALLSVVMFDSLWGLNPVVIIGSIFSTFFGYVVMAGFILALVLLLLKVTDYTGRFAALDWGISAFSIYTLMLISHILGRFYYRYEEKLNWEV
jgi:hypothetical protein